MLDKFSVFRIAYFDTNIISELSQNENEDLVRSLSNFFIRHNMVLGFGEGNILELSDAERQYHSIISLILHFPSVILRLESEILKYEISSYLDPSFPVSVIRGPINPILLETDGLKKLYDLLAHPEIKKERANQKRLAKLLGSVHEQARKNFPPHQNGTYSPSQADDFVRRIVEQRLEQAHPEFVRANQDVRSEVFKSIQLYAYVIFYKYYIGRQQPKKLSDFGDLFHLAVLPYCDLVVLERSLCEILKQVKRNHPILANTEIRNIDFVRKREWVTDETFRKWLYSPDEIQGRGR